MALLELPVSSELKAYEFQIDLNGVTYTLRFNFNRRMGLWLMDIADLSGNDILSGIPLQANIDLLIQYTVSNLPFGRFILIDESGEEKNPGENDLGNDVKLLYEEA